MRTERPSEPKTRTSSWKARDRFASGRRSVLPEAIPGALRANFVYHAHPATEAERGKDALVVGLYGADPVTLTIVPRPAR